MTESIRNEGIYILTGDQLKQFANQILTAYIESQKAMDPIFLNETCSKSDAARHLKKNRVTIYNMIKDGRLKASSNGDVIVSSILDYKNRLVEDKKVFETNKRGKKVYV